MSVSTFKVEIIGKMPLLMHMDSIEGRDELEGWRGRPENKKLSKPGDDRTPPWTWRTYMYHDQTSVTLAFNNLQRAMSQGATNVKQGKGAKSWKADSIGEVLFDKEHLPLECRCDPNKPLRSVAWEDVLHVAELKMYADQVKGAEKLGFRLFAKPVTVNKNKHIRVRPRFDEWKVTTVLTVGDDRITTEVLKQWFFYAGKAGVGDGRPSSPRTPYPYGTFDTKVTEI